MSSGGGAPVFELRPSGAPGQSKGDESFQRAVAENSWHLQPPATGGYVDEEDVLGPQDPHGLSTTSWASSGGAQSRQAAGPPSTSAALPPIRSSKGPGGSSKQHGQQQGPGTGFQHIHQQQHRGQHGGQGSTKPARSAQGSPPRTAGSRASVSSFSPYGQQPGAHTVPGAKPKPKARHDQTAIDPAFIETAVFRNKKGVGKVYDWQAQHAQNARLAKQRKEQQRMELVLEAARRQIQAREESDHAFQLWLAQKKQEKEVETFQRRRAVMVAKLYQEMTKDDPYELAVKESAWCGNFGAKAEPSGALLQAVRPALVSQGTTAGGTNNGQRFRFSP